MNRLGHKYEEYESTYDQYDDYKSNHCKCYRDCKCDKKHDNKHDDNCVEDVLYAILKAQRKAKKDARHCGSSCQESINDLLGKNKRVTKNTVPFILYCGCEPFKGTGVLTYTCHSKKKKKLKCIESFVFKIKDLKKDCAVLELLAFKCDLKYSHDCNLTSPCRQIDNKCLDELTRTGICMTVDLSRITSITCLPAVYL